MNKHQEPEAPEPTSDETPEPHRLDATVGAQFVIRVTSHTDGGYQWTLEDGWRKSGLLELVGHRYEPPPNSGPGGVVGGSGHDEWTFRPVAAGEATITLVNKRSWEKEPGSRSVYVVTIS